MNQARRGGGQRGIANLAPEPEQVLVIAADLGLGALAPGGAHDDRHAFGYIQALDDPLQAPAVGGIADLAADASALARVRHEHAVAAGERQVTGERGALVTAFLLGHLDQDHLAALDDLLNLVLAQQAGAPAGGVVDLVAADRVDPGFGRDFFDRAVARLRPGSIVFGALVFGAPVFGAPVFGAPVFGAPVFGAFGLGRAFGLRSVAFLLIRIAQVVLGRLAPEPRFLGDQGLPVGDRDAVIVRMDFAERQEPVTVAAVFHERGLKRGFDPRDLGEVDVALKLFLRGAFVVELFETVSA